uniref:non-specific serine/threonine protein kinase n=1 Tax=Oryzias latipes TaxID=8090 RepID=A0A3P9L057_ORYLA
QRSWRKWPEGGKSGGNPAKYVELHPLGEGGCGSVFAGYRRSDHLDVAIKHVPNKYQELSGEVAVMLKLRSGTSHSPSSRAPITLLDWYVLPHELILVLERPMPAVDLQTYVEECRDWFGEKEAKMILKQLVKAAISLQDKKIFHRDIKVENILIDMSSGAPQVRLIDFGVSCFTESHSEYTTFYGTEIHAPPEWISHVRVGSSFCLWSRSYDNHIIHSSSMDSDFRISVMLTFTQLSMSEGEVRPGQFLRLSEGRAETQTHIHT